MFRFRPIICFVVASEPIFAFALEIDVIGPSLLEPMSSLWILLGHDKPQVVPNSLALGLRTLKYGSG